MNRLFTFIIMVCLCLVGFNHANAQSGVIKGTVTDASNGETLPGVSILVKGTNSGTQTDAKGEFSIKAAGNATLVFNYVGYLSKEVAVNNQTTLNVKLDVSSKELEQVVVVGYGVQKKSDVTGAVTQVTAKDISYQASANPAQSLQGKVAGVTVTNTGTPGSQPTVRIRGLGSVSSNSNPLYVVDGVLTRDITFLNNNDIETFNILKDASASAIYGVQAANGVIIITTKRGKSGKPLITYSGYMGFQKPTNMVDMTNGSQYIELLNEKGQIMADRAGQSYTPINGAAYPASTDWYDQILRSSAMIQNHELNFSGGNEKTQYAVGASYFKQEGLAKENDYARVNLKTAVDTWATDFLKVGANINLSSATSNNAPDNIFKDAYVAPSAVGVTNPDGTFTSMMDFGSFPNPAAKLYYNNNKTNALRLVGGAYLEVHPIKNLSVKSALYVDGTQSTNRKYTPWYKVSSVQTDTTLTLAKKIEDPFSYTWDNTATYKFEINEKHSLTAMLGTSMLQDRYHSMTATRQGVKDYGDGSWYLGNGSDKGQSNAESVDLYRSFSLFGRLNYSYLQRYLFTATLRRDEASIFPKDNRADFFPSVGLGWVISQENFMANQNAFQNLKLRASWGKMGNSRIPLTVVPGLSTGGNYSGVFGGNIITGANITQVGPRNLLWETTDEFDVAIEGATLRNRLTFEIDYYNKKTKNAIFPVTTVTTIGASNTSYLDNNADVVNKGLELSLGWKDRIGEFSYSIGGNIATNKNEVTRLKEGTLGIYGGSVNYINTTYTTVGRSIGEFYGRKVIGVFQNQSEIDNYKNQEGIVIQPQARPGDFIYQDTNGDGKINDYDRVFLGTAIPTYSFGINLGGSYKNFDLTVDMYGQGGNKVYNAKRFRQLGNENYDLDFYNNRWHGEGTSHTYPSADVVSETNKLASSFYVESGDMFKVRNIQLGYTFPQKMISKLKINGLRVYANVANPFNFFNYNGFTPEVTNIDLTKSYNEQINATSQGIDLNVYPMSTVYNFGINLTL